MDKVLNFQISLFGSFIDIKPKTDIILKLLTNLKEEQFIPGTVDLATLDIATGKVATESRIQFLSQDKIWSIAFLQERIDFNYNYQEGKQENNSIERLYSYASELIKKTFYVFGGTRGNRLAVNAKILMDEMPEDKFDTFTKNFTVPLKIYNEKVLDEWSVRYNCHEKMSVNRENTEESNCVMELSTVMSGAEQQQKRIVLSLDVNTMQENRELRFNYENLLYFAKDAHKYIVNVLNEIEGA